MTLLKICFVLITLIGLPIPSLVSANTPNQTIDSFNSAKRYLERSVYFDNRITFYCQAKFDDQKNITLPVGFTTTTHVKRAKRVEWEHVTAAENFGRTFQSWREGHLDCVDNKGKSFKGRNCASKVDMEYRFMQADMYNLVPAIGAVNAKRSNYRFTMLGENEPSDFGSCPMKVENRAVEPPEVARGEIARTHLYMEAAYPRFKLSSAQRRLMNVWDRQYPVTPFECLKTKRIESIQKNINDVVKSRCEASGFR